MTYPVTIEFPTKYEAEQFMYGDLDLPAWIPVKQASETRFFVDEFEHSFDEDCADFESGLCSIDSHQRIAENIEKAYRERFANEIRNSNI